MPISALQRERLERSLREHEVLLQRSDRPLSDVAATVHGILLELGRNEDVLALVDDFVDSSELADKLRDDASSVLRARGIDLPEGVTMHVVDGYGDEPKPILRFEVAVRNVSVLAEWDPKLGVSTQVQRAPD
jgi:hypothetical protein